MSSQSVEVLDREYVMNHGAKPRGRGNWAFCLVNPNRSDYLDFVVWANGRYSDAEKAAKAVLLGKLEAPGEYPVGKETVRVNFKPEVAELVKSGRHASVLYVCS